MISQKKMVRVLEILRRYPNKFYNVDFWRVTMNIEMKNKNWTMSNKETANILNYFRKKRIIERAGNYKSHYLYKVVKWN